MVGVHLFYSVKYQVLSKLRNKVGAGPVTIQMGRPHIVCATCIKVIYGSTLYFSPVHSAKQSKHSQMTHQFESNAKR